MKRAANQYQNPRGYMVFTPRGLACPETFRKLKKDCKDYWCGSDPKIWVPEYESHGWTIKKVRLLICADF